MGGKCPFWLFVGLLSSDESVQSRSVCRTEKRVFFIVFIGVSDIFLIFAPKIKTKKRMEHQVNPDAVQEGVERENPFRLTHQRLAARSPRFPS
jgi:hypothetical protein